MADELTCEETLDETFAILADTLLAGYYAVELMQTLVESCASLFDMAAAGILLVDGNGEIEAIASTSEASRLVEVMQLSAQAGPCVECFESGSVVSQPDISASPARWNQFTHEALSQGFHSVYAIPMGMKNTTIGTLNLLRSSVGELDRFDVRAAQALTAVATVGILHERALREGNAIRDQLAAALDSRVVIEQAKGVLAHTHGATMDEAFSLLRGYARSHNQKLSVVANDIVTHGLRISDSTAATGSTPTPRRYP